MKVAITIILLAVLGQTVVWIIRFLEKREDSKIPKANDTPESWPEADVDPKLVLQRWRRKDSKEIRLAGPVHESIEKALNTYNWIGPDEYFRPVNRERIAVAWRDADYLQIGEWGEGSEVLTKRDCLDPKIYVAEIEDANEGEPVVVAGSLDEFLKKAWAYHQDSLR